MWPARAARALRRLDGVGRAALWTLSLVGALAGCGADRYEAEGRVVAVDVEGRRATLAHGPIPGYMPAMTMAFPVGDGEPLDALAPGDGVRFVLRVEGERFWIEGLRPDPDAAAVAPAVAPGGASVLEPGDRVPPFDLVGGSGRPVRLADYAGGALVVSFVYARCPVPTACPLTMRRLSALAPTLEDRFGRRAAVLAVTLDPEHDTPDVLKDYGRRYGAGDHAFRLATGEVGEVTRLARVLGVLYGPAGGSANRGALIDHTLATALVGPDGRLVRHWRGSDWDPAEVERAVAATLERARPSPSAPPRP